jgi:hypothetical protein
VFVFTVVEIELARVEEFNSYAEERVVDGEVKGVEMCEAECVLIKKVVDFSLW